jgi:hypothetical protein
MDQPPIFEEQGSQLPEVPNLANLTNLFPSRENFEEKTENSPPDLGVGQLEQGDLVQALIDKQWKNGRVIREAPSMKLGPKSRKLEVAYEVKIRRSKVVVTADCLRRYQDADE